MRISRYSTAALLALLIALPLLSYAEEGLHVTDYLEARVYYTQPLKSDADKVIAEYREALKAVASKIKVPAQLKAEIVLVANEADFLDVAGSSMIAAFAEPARSMIVIDYRKVLTAPFNLRGTLTHETSHIALGKRIPNAPKWLDEGIAEWISDGQGEVISPLDGEALNKAVKAGALIRLGYLERKFPQDAEGFVLAYEQSKSAVQYIVAEHGEAGLSKVLDGLEAGKDIQGAVKDALGVSFGEFEDGWSKYALRKASWLSYLSQYFFSIVLAMTALIAIAAGVAAYIRYRKYKDIEEASDIGYYKQPDENKNPGDGSDVASGDDDKE